MTEPRPTRIRRGKVVVIPEEWRGKVTGHQLKNGRRASAKLKRKTAPHHREARQELDERRREREKEW